jgi:GMP synthase (glutamine-hydrolysing)
MGDTSIPAGLRYLLLQVRHLDDPMRRQEVHCFARTLGCAPERITAFDVLNDTPPRAELDRHDVVLLGGSGDYSVATGQGVWLDRILDVMRQLYDEGKPTFASCWGFQAMARATGGRVIHDPQRGELGTLPVRLTDAGLADPVFGPLGPTFLGQMGHEDRVERLPPGAVLLASTDVVAHQAYTFPGKPIYCTQFHPELDRCAMLERVEAYPRYVERISGLTLEKFTERCRDSADTACLLPRFVEQVFGRA